MAAYLLRHLDKASALLEGGRLSLFFDYDGTLTGITGRPSEASLDPKTRELVARLASCFPVAIVSGRSLPDIRARVGIESIAYAGCHGLEISSPGFKMTYDIGGAASAALDVLRPRLSALAERYRGVILEDKGPNLTVHYRLIDPGEFPAFKEAFETAVRDVVSKEAVRLTFSKKAFEIRAGGDWGKGKALEWMLERPLFKGTVPLYMGDDDTDRDAYRSVGPGGICVNVGGEVDEAGYYLNTQKEVEPFLEWMCSRKRQSSPPD